MKRIPLWLTIVPLALGGAIYWHFWSGWRDTLRRDVVAEMPGATMTIGGFPYRLEADVAHPRFTVAGPAALALQASRALINRNPWQRDLSVIRSDHPRLTASLPLTGAHATLAAATATTSVHLSPRGIARLSTVFATATGTTGLFTAPVVADTLEVHLRETRARSNEAWSATPPQQAQVVVDGRGVRFGDGTRLTVAVDVGITAVARLTTFDAWRGGGTVELRSAVLGDSTGEVARLTASAVPNDSTVRLAGTITTVCPQTVAAAFAATVPPRELRLRNAVRLPFGGTPGSFVLGAPPAGASTVIRAQEPPCPRLR